MNPYKINLKGTEPTELKALINMFNLLSEDIVNGSVKQAKKDIIDNKEKQENEHNINKEAIISANDMIAELCEEI